jgi:alkyl hydroperoxide reductase subunit F
MPYDLIIIGGGPAGVAAGVYAARKRLKTLFLTYDFGGQSTVSPDIQNWIGTKSISGEALGRQLKEHLYAYEGENFQIKTGVKVRSVSKAGEQNFTVVTEEGETFDARAVLVTTGAARRRLEVPGAKEYEQKGITYCASCDGPVFTDQDVAVIGGGNAAFETVMQLTAYCRSVTLLNRGPEFKADQITVEKVQAHPKVKLIVNAEIQEIRGQQFVTTLVYRDAASGENKELPVTGIFVEIGFVPATGFVKDLVKTTPHGAIMVDHRSQRTSVPGVWAAGDCTDGLYHQNNIAAGDAIKALEDIYNYLHLS